MGIGVPSILVTRERVGVLCVEKKKLLMVRLRDPIAKRSYLFPPGGAIEPGELPEQAAIRETREETGYEVELMPEGRFTLDYPFQWKGKVTQCGTHFFRARLRSTQPGPILDMTDFEGVEWVEVSRLATALDYPGPLREGLLAALQQG